MAYDVAKTKEVRNAFRRAMAAEPTRWDWTSGGHVPSALTEEGEAEREERERAKAKEKKKRAEKARKERRKADESARADAVATLRAATSDDGVEPLEAALKALTTLCDGDGGGGGGGEVAEAIAAATARLAELRDPDWQRRRERERRAEAAERRLGGLSAAQRAFMSGGGVSAGSSARKP